MNVVLALLITGLVLVLAVMAGLLLLALHIRGEERRQSLSQVPRSRGGAVARRVLGSCANPSARVRRVRVHARR